MIGGWDTIGFAIFEPADIWCATGNIAFVAFSLASIHGAKQK